MTAADELLVLCALLLAFTLAAAVVTITDLLRGPEPDQDAIAEHDLYDQEDAA